MRCWRGVGLRVRAKFDSDSKREGYERENKCNVSTVFGGNEHRIASERRNLTDRYKQRSPLGPSNES
jgi:hypothetical protein